MTSITCENRPNLVRNAFDSVFLRLFVTLGLAVWIALMAGCHRSAPPMNPRQIIVARVVDQLPLRYQGKLGRNWGGDEFEILEPRYIHYVRLAGIHGPEPGQPFWHAARNYFWKTHMGKSVDVELVGYDECKCELARITLDGKDLGLTMIEKGWAWCDSSSQSFPGYLEAQEQAKQDGKGVWSLNPPVSPMVYRNQQEQIYLQFLRSQIEQ